MGMVYGSMRHASTGRKKKTNYWKKSKGYSREFRPLETVSTSYRETPHYPSVDAFAKPSSKPDQLSKEERLERSAQYTVAIAYNKGAYMVIPKENIEHIGK